MTDTAQLPWCVDTLMTTPEIFPVSDFTEDGVEALFYESVPWHGTPTRVFAWIGIPEGDGPFPAMVLVHGGGGTAFAEWVRMWTARGYAAIAMDTCGCLAGGEHSKRLRNPHGGPAGWGGFEQIDEPIEDQWSYHAVAAVVRAHSLLRAQPRVDAECIGITGISWGGYLTCIVASIDPRFRCAAPVYGCGFLGEDSFWLQLLDDLGDERRRRWLALWDPSVYLPTAACPLLWVTGTNDFAYPMGSLQRSYRLPHCPRTLAVRVNMPHSQEDGMVPDEIHAFINHHLRGGTPLATIIAQGEEGSTAWLRFATQIPVVRAEFNYTCDAGPWQSRTWAIVDAGLHSDTAVATIPDRATAYYLNVVDAESHIVSGEHVAVG
ncbi:MAG: alpha/beta hydrolase family protein [Armatimonadota bacterium]